MPIDLPVPLDAYFAAKNARDIDAMLAPFADDAVVKDEGEWLHGREAIRDWMVKTTSKYGVRVDVLDVASERGSATVTARVSGNFPGSPIVLRYDFGLADAKITRLAIG